MIVSLPLEWKKYSWIFLGIGLFLVLLFSVVFSESESEKYKQISQKLCNGNAINPDEVQFLMQFLAQSENIEITDLETLQDFLCGNKDYFFPNKEQLAKIFGNSGYFHNEVKVIIKKEAKKFMKKLGTQNPDIGYHLKSRRIILKNPITKRTVETDLLIDWYIP